MSNTMTDLSKLTAATSTGSTPISTKKKSSTSLDLDDFLQLIVSQFQNQDPENAASTTDMMNSMVQMSVVQAISTVTDAATMLYTSSLVGKDVTVGEVDKSGTLQEIAGKVTATGTYNGEPVIFLDGVSYKLSSIMAVGRLPEKKPATPPATPPTTPPTP